MIMMLSREKDKSKKRRESCAVGKRFGALRTASRHFAMLRAASLAEMIVALGIAGSAIFAMLYLAAKTAKQARVNQERYIGAEAAADGISLAIVAKNALLQYVCDTGSAEVGILALPGDPTGYEILSTDRLTVITFGEETYRLLPQSQNTETGVWEECLGCNEDTAYLFRGLDIERAPAESHWTVKSITWWKVFGSPEITIIETRLPDGCE